MNVSESIQQGPLTATGTAFRLKGGWYIFALQAQSTGQKATLSMLAPDGQNWLPVPSSDGDVVGDASLLGNGTCTVHCAPGQHQFTLVGNFVNAYLSVTSLLT